MKKYFLSMVAVSAFSLAAGAASAQSHGVYIDQVASESSVNISQSGKSNRVGDSATARAQSSGYRNNIAIEQDGSSNVISRFLGVDGTGNNVRVAQYGTGNQVSYSSTIGNDNSISLTQKGNSNKAVTWLRGDSNSINVETSGNSNSAEVAISGYKNSINLSQSGNSNRAAVSTSGYGSSMSISQR